MLSEVGLCRGQLDGRQAATLKGGSYRENVRSKCQRKHAQMGDRKEKEQLPFVCDFEKQAARWYGFIRSKGHKFWVGKEQH